MKNNLFSAGYQRERMTAYALQTSTQASILKPLCSVLFSVSFLMVNSSQAFAFSIKNQVVAAGGGSAKLGSSTLTATIGQAAVGTMSGGGYELTAGFWPEASPTASSVDNNADGSDQIPPLPRNRWLLMKMAQQIPAQPSS